MNLKVLLILLLPLMNYGQWSQIGDNVIGESSGDESGKSVSLSADGKILAIGAISNDGNGSNSGHVRIYECFSGVWSQVGADINGESSGDEFGVSVSLSSDGGTVAIGSRYNDGNGNDSGHVRVYENVSGVWTQIGVDIDGETIVNFSGYSLSLSSDGGIVAIGAYINNGSDISSGHVRVYENVSGVWTQIGADIDGEAINDFSGYSVSINSVGNIVAIGARLNDGNGNDSGHVRVYENIMGDWVQLGGDIDGESTNDFSGYSVSLSENGRIVAIGALTNDGNGSDSGHVRVYEYLSGVWGKIGLDINGEGIGDYSGASVSISSDGSVVAIGAYLNDGNGNDSGHVRVYENVSGLWSQLGTDIDGGVSGNQFGYSVSLSSDGSVLAAGSPLSFENGSNSGLVRVFKLTELSVQDNAFGEIFSVYPNPSFGMSKILLGESYNEVSVNVFNVLGKQVASQKYNNTNEIELNTEEYATGIYFIKVQSGAKEAIIKLIVK